MRPAIGTNSSRGESIVVAPSSFTVDASVLDGVGSVGVVVDVGFLRIVALTGRTALEPNAT